MAGDPPLDQVVTRTWEARRPRAVPRRELERWRLPGRNHDDILFVTSEQTGFGYFRNFGETRRAGLELGANGTVQARHGRRRLHLPRCDLRERRDGQRREQQQQRRRRGGRARARGHDRDRAGRPDAVHPGASAESVRRHPGDVTAVARRESHRRLELVRARQREQSPRGRWRVLPRPRRGTRLRHRESRRLPTGSRAGSRPSRRSTTCSIAATTPPPSSGRSASPTPALSSPGRFPPSMASFHSAMERSSRLAHRSGCGSARARRSDQR